MALFREELWECTRHTSIESTMGGFNADRISNRISNRIILERYSIARAENYQLQIPLVQIHFLPLSIRTDDGRDSQFETKYR